MEHHHSLTFHVGAVPKHLELLVGDLSAMSGHDPVDVLVVSALPNDYRPTPDSVIGALHRAGVDVAALARDPEYDLRQFWHSWLSRPIGAGHGFTRLLCFEPPRSDHPGDVVGSIFRAVAPFVGPLGGIATLAMPLVSTGVRGAALEDVFPRQLDAAYDALCATSLKRVAVVVRDTPLLAAVRPLFDAFRQRHLGAAPGGTPLAPVHDVFLSYSRRNWNDAEAVLAALREAMPTIHIFRDLDSLRGGIDYRTQLDRGLRSTRRVVALYTPEYLASAACQDEFNTAWRLHEDGHEGLLAPLFVRSNPTASACTPIDDLLDRDRRRTTLHWVDCREADQALIRRACARIVDELTR